MFQILITILLNILMNLVYVFESIDKSLSSILKH